jgi:hypothetical protein
MDLRGAGGELHATCREWGSLLRLAHENGWKPQGTDYFTNDGQLVTEEDASAIAGGLEKALRDPAPPCEEFSADRKYRELLAPNLRERVDGFIKYCRAGGFYIY